MRDIQVVTNLRQSKKYKFLCEQFWAKLYLMNGFFTQKRAIAREIAKWALHKSGRFSASTALLAEAAMKSFLGLGMLSSVVRATRVTRTSYAREAYGPRT